MSKNKLSEAHQKEMIIGNVTEEGKQNVYHEPDMVSYTSVKYDPARGDQVFMTTADAEAAGFQPADVERIKKVAEPDPEPLVQPEEPSADEIAKKITEFPVPEKYTADEYVEILRKQNMQAVAADPTHTQMGFEVLEGKVFNIPQNEAKIAVKNPKKLPPEKQVKYYGKTQKEWNFPNGHKGDAPEGYVIEEYEVTNPFTKKTKTIARLVEIPKTEEEEIENDPDSNIDRMKGKIEMRVTKLKWKVLKGKIEEEEVEELKLLTL